ncbi:MAG: hypothetical protein ACLR0P_14235 [Oscillospiraceae bacterium]
MVATLVNDKQLKLSLYFSYAYEGPDLCAARAVDVSIPAVMRNLHRNGGEASTRSTTYPRKGAVHFEARQWSLTTPAPSPPGMDASAIAHRRRWHPDLPLPEWADRVL